MEKAIESGIVKGALKKGISSKRKRQSILAWAFLGPMAIYYTVFFVLPIAFVILISFCNWKGLFLEDITFAGFDNFTKIFTNVSYLRVFGNTLLMGGIILIINMVVGLFVAQILIKNIYLKSMQRLLWYLPVVISMAVMSDIFAKFLVNGREGTFNMMLLKIGAAPVLWSESTGWMFFWIIFLSVWKGLGSTIIYNIAGLQGIPKEMYEVGKIEGCNRWQRFRYITFPMLRPMTSFIFITSLINIFNIFEPVQIISQGGPGGTTEVIMFKIYNEAFQNFDMGISNAISVVVMLIVVTITAFSLKSINISLD